MEGLVDAARKLGTDATQKGSFSHPNIDEQHDYLDRDQVVSHSQLSSHHWAGTMKNLSLT